jgi:microcystin-dependent protein
MPNQTPRLNLQEPVTTDGPSELRLAVTNHATTLDGAVLFSEGTLANIPAPGQAGRRYYATDSKIELFDNGSAWIPASSGPPVGVCMGYTAGTADPVDAGGIVRWMVCDGRAISRTQYSELNAIYSANNYPWGGGDGVSTFNIPNAQGKVQMGATGTGAPYGFGQTGGALGHSHAIPGLSIPSLSVPGLPIPQLGVTVGGHIHGLSTNGYANIGVGNAGVAGTSTSTAIMQGPNGGTFAGTERWGDNHFWAFDSGGPGYAGSFGAPGLGGVTDNSGATGATSTGSTSTGSTGSGTTAAGTTGGADQAYLAVPQIVKVL